MSRARNFRRNISAEGIRSIDVNFSWLPDIIDFKMPVEPDILVFLLERNKRIPSLDYAIFSRPNLQHASKTIDTQEVCANMIEIHTGFQNLTGMFKEHLTISLEAIPVGIKQIVLAISLKRYSFPHAPPHAPNALVFGKIKDPLFTMTNHQSGEIFYSVNMNEKFSGDDVVILDRLIRENDDWFIDYASETITGGESSLFKKFTEEFLSPLCSARATATNSYHIEKEEKLFGPYSKVQLLAMLQPPEIIIGRNMQSTMQGGAMSGLSSGDKHPKPEGKMDIELLKPRQWQFLHVFLWILVFSTVGMTAYFYAIGDAGEIPEADTMNITPSYSEGLMEMDIFDLYKVKAYQPGPRQKILADSFFVEGLKQVYEKKDFIAAIGLLKLSLRNNPQSRTYYELAKVYLNIRYLDKGLDCAQTAMDLGFSPQSKCQILVAYTYALQKDFLSVTPILQALILTDPSLKAAIEIDTVFLEYRYSSEYGRLFEQADRDSASTYFEMISKFIADLNSNTEEAKVYFNDTIRTNISADDFSDLWYTSSESEEMACRRYKVELIGNCIFRSGLSPEGFVVFTCWLNAVCWQVSEQRYQIRRVKTEFTFGPDERINRYKVIDVKDLKLSMTPYL